MKSFIRVTIQSILLFAATILPGITAALRLSPWLYLLSGVIFVVLNIIPFPAAGLPGKLKQERHGFYMKMRSEEYHDYE